MPTINKKTFLSPRFWDIAVFVMSLMPMVMEQYVDAIFDAILIIIALIIAIVVSFVNAQAAYDIEDDITFRNDIRMDAAYMVVAFTAFSLLFLEVPITTSLIQLVVIFMTVADFWVSLKGGASKLLEMDKANVRGHI